MRQYRTYSEGQYSYITDPVTGLRVRTGQRDHVFVEDRELSVGGFSLVEDTGWENLRTVTGTCVTGGKVREGVRDTDYVVDIELSVGGFALAEDVGWENVDSGWSSYWASQDEVLFFAEIKNIADGKLYNKKTGSSDYLTVTGSAGSYTFQCPDTAAYIAADTDYIWFRINESQRTTTEAELVGYDFTRTIIKYDNTDPYAIRWIMILSEDYDTNAMRDSFELSYWWDNTLSLHGHTKGNRGTGQSVWVAESYTKLLLHLDNNVTDSSLITKTVTNNGSNVTFATTGGKFSYYAIFPGNNAYYLHTPKHSDFDMGAGDFTIDLWFYPTRLNGVSSDYLCGQADAAATPNTRQFQFAIGADKKLTFALWDTTPTRLNSTAATTILAINNWYHIALVRYGNTATGYVNGVPECTLDLTGKTLQYADSLFSIGRLGVYNTECGGRIDEFRISKGIARWTADFSASLPAAPYTID